MALLPLVHELWRLLELGQAAVAIMAVMMVPVSRLGSSGFLLASRRIRLRVLGSSLKPARRPRTGSGAVNSQMR